MATRNDISVLWNLNPRLIIVDAPSTEITIQDLHDTLRDIEDEPGVMQYQSLITTAGKENLGGGVSVGLTATLINARVMFERRATIISEGTITTPSVPGNAVQLIDSAANFIADNIEPGDVVLNIADSSHAEVLEIISGIELVILSPTGGAENDYDVGEGYQIFATIECTISGGNLVGLDNVGNELDVVFPSFGTSVVRTSSSSATLQELGDIQYSSFNGGVTIDVIYGVPGTFYPIGTPRAPVNNLLDAKSIATSRGFDTYFIRGNLTVDSGTHPMIFIGQSPVLSAITLNPLANMTKANFQNATINGTLDGNAMASECHIDDLNFFSGVLDRCVLEGTITLGGGVEALILDCWSGVLGSPKLDMGGSGQSLALRNYNGDIEIKNKTGVDDPISIDLSSGQIIINNNVIAGEIILRGVGKWANRDIYTGGANIVDELVEIGQQINAQDVRDAMMLAPSAMPIELESIDHKLDSMPGDVATEINTQIYDGVSFADILQDLLSMAKGRIVENPAGTFTFYEQDNNTPRFVLVKTGIERVRS